MTFGLFVSSVYLPFYHRKWKGSTRGTNDDRINRYLVSKFKQRKLGTFRRDELQDFLDRRADEGWPTAPSRTCVGTCARFSEWLSRRTSL